MVLNKIRTAFGRTGSKPLSFKGKSPLYYSQTSTDPSCTRQHSENRKWLSVRKQSWWSAQPYLIPTLPPAQEARVLCSVKRIQLLFGKEA